MPRFENIDPSTAHEIATAVQGRIGNGFYVEASDHDRRGIYASTEPVTYPDGSSQFNLYSFSGEIFVVDVRRIET